MGKEAVTQSTAGRRVPAPPPPSAPSARARPDDTRHRQARVPEAQQRGEAREEVEVVPRTRTHGTADRLGIAENEHRQHDLRASHESQQPECTNKQVGDVSNTVDTHQGTWMGYCKEGGELSRSHMPTRRRHIDHPLPLT